MSKTKCLSWRGRWLVSFCPRSIICRFRDECGFRACFQSYWDFAPSAWVWYPKFYTIAHSLKWQKKEVWATNVTQSRLTLMIRISCKFVATLFSQHSHFSVGFKRVKNRWKKEIVIISLNSIIFAVVNEAKVYLWEKHFSALCKNI